jgi:uncharacterized RDD family membrane protein YckC
MKSSHVRLAAWIAAIAVSAGAIALRAQPSDSGGLRASIALQNFVHVHSEMPLPMIAMQGTYDGWGRNMFRLGQDYELREGESAHDVVTVFSDATIEGTMLGDLVVVFGTVRVGPTASINGSLIAVGGNVEIQPGAAVRRDLIVVGGGLDAPPSFVPGGEHFAIGAKGIADRLHTIVPWLTEGLLLGRPIVPRLSWVWAIVGFTFLASIALALLFLGSVRTCADAVAARPFTTFLVGLLVLLLTGPVSLILAASVIGITVVPFVLCAIVVAWIIGKIGLTVRLGDSMVGQTPPATRLQTVRSLTLGFAAICLLYMIPIVGLITWALVGVSGLGAATIAFMSAYRRENPTLPKARKPAPTAPPDTPIVPDLGPAPAMLAASDIPLSAPYPDDPPLAPPAVAVTPVTSMLAFPKAEFLPRACALLLDVAFVTMVGGMVDAFEGPDQTPGPILFLMLLYFVSFWAWKGTTFGGIVCRLRIVRLDGSPLRFVDALVRGIASLFSVAVVGLGFFWILKDEERQAWHDLIAGTYVLSVPRNWPLT